MLLSSRARKGHEPASGGVREPFVPVPLLKLLRFKTVKCQQQMSYYIAQGTTQYPVINQNGKQYEKEYIGMKT